MSDPIYPTVKVPQLYRDRIPISGPADLYRRKGRTKTRLRILTRDNFTCNKCDESYPETYLEVDHIIPLSQGGPDNDSNSQTLCIPCHAAKTTTERQGRIII